jgi:hypothetical protein
MLLRLDRFRNKIRVASSGQVNILAGTLLDRAALAVKQDIRDNFMGKTASK